VVAVNSRCHSRTCFRASPAILSASPRALASSAAAASCSATTTVHWLLASISIASACRSLGAPPPMRWISSARRLRKKRQRLCSLIRVGVYRPSGFRRDVAQSCARVQACRLMRFAGFDRNPLYLVDFFRKRVPQISKNASVVVEKSDYLGPSPGVGFQRFQRDSRASLRHLARRGATAG